MFFGEGCRRLGCQSPLQSPLPLGHTALGRLTPGADASGSPGDPPPRHSPCDPASSVPSFLRSLQLSRLCLGCLGDVTWPTAGQHSCLSPSFKSVHCVSLQVLKDRRPALVSLLFLSPSLSPSPHPYPIKCHHTR